MNLKEKYRFFLQHKLDNYYLFNKKDLTVLGENIINGTYFVIAETPIGHSPIERYIFTTEKDKISRFKIETITTNKGYIILYKQFLSNVLSAKIYKKFVSRGIALDVATGLRLGNYCCWHRIILCLYFDIKGLDVHHINKDVNDNNINNLLPISYEIHNQLHENKLDENRIIKQLQNNFFKQLNNKRQTFINSDENILRVLTLKSQGYSVKDIVKNFEFKISQRSIYNVLEYFSSYRSEFLNSINNSDTKSLYAKSSDKWDEVSNFNSILDKNNKIKINKLNNLIQYNF